MDVVRKLPSLGSCWHRPAADRSSLGLLVRPRISTAISMSLICFVARNQAGGVKQICGCFCGKGRLVATSVRESRAELPRVLLRPLRARCLCRRTTACSCFRSTGAYPGFRIHRSGNKLTLNLGLQTMKWVLEEFRSSRCAKPAMMCSYGFPSAVWALPTCVLVIAAREST